MSVSAMVVVIWLKSSRINWKSELKWRQLMVVHGGLWPTFRGKGRSGFSRQRIGMLLVVVSMMRQQDLWWRVCAAASFG